jgi:regulator of protease activity HflC (stomatin/prohibitin superfamily)
MMDTVYFVLLVALYTTIIVGPIAAAIITVVKFGREGIFWVIPGEGKAIPIMVGGTFEKVVLQYKGHVLNDPKAPWYVPEKPDWEVLPDQRTPKDIEDEKEKHGRIRRLFRRVLGMEWIGFPPRRAYTYMFEWVQRIQDQKGDTVPWHRRESTNYIYVNTFPYLLYLQEAETEENLPVSGYLVLEVECTNPYKALFRTTNWYTAVTSAVLLMCKLYVARCTFEQLRQETGKEGGFAEGDPKGQLNEYVKKLNEELPSENNEGTVSKYGIKIVSVRLLNIEVAQEHNEILAALSAKFVATQNATAEVTRAKGDKDARITRAEGFKREAELLREGGEEARLVQYLNGLAPKGAGDKIVIMPGLEDLVRRIKE